MDFPISIHLTKLKLPLLVCDGKLQRFEKSIEASRSKKKIRVKGRTSKAKAKNLHLHSTLFYCGYCDDWLVDICTQHPYTYIPDKAMENMLEEEELCLARASSPNCVQVGLSHIAGAGRGVWDEKDIKPNTLFGPYMGRIVRSVPEDSSYTWEMNCNGKEIFVDGADESCSNWMRYINHAQKPNLVAFQYMNQIWYVSNATIIRGSELFVSYGEDYGKVIANSAHKFSNQRRTLPMRSLCENARTYPCLQCTIHFSRDSYLKLHQDKFHKPKIPTRFRCDICQGYYTSKNGVRKHIDAIHRNDPTFDCEQCGRKFFQRPHLKKHILSTHDKRVVKCDICQKSFRSIWLMRHFIRMHCSMDKQYVCGICRRLFSDMVYLNVHQRAVHLGLKTYQCGICEKRVVSKQALIIHMRVHNGEKPYSCTACPRTFAYKPSLKTHMKTHTGEKPYICDVCGKGAADVGGFVVHLRTHTGEKPYECDSCGHQSTTAGAHACHKRTHSTQSSYQCPHCEKKYRHRGALRTHVRLHTGEKPYQCEFCCDRFIRLDYKQWHVNKIHLKCTKREMNRKLKKLNADNDYHP